MRLTLEQLKAMSVEELGKHWTSGAFPFEYLPCRGGCLTMHTHGCSEHPEVTANVLPLQMYGSGGNMKMPEFSVNLKAHLEELYALRLFYDSLYPPAEPEQQPEPRIERITVRPREIKNLEPLNDWETGQVQPEDKALAQLADEHFDFRANTRG